MHDVTTGVNDDGGAPALVEEFHEVARTAQDWAERLKGRDGTDPGEFFDRMARVEERSRRDLKVLSEQHTALAQQWHQRRAVNAEQFTQLREMDLGDADVAEIEEQRRRAEELGIEFDADMLLRHQEQMRNLRDAAMRMVGLADNVAGSMKALNEVLALGLDRARQGRRRVEAARRRYTAWRVVFVILAAVVAVVVDQGWDLLVASTSIVASVVLLLVDNQFELVIKRLQNRTVRRIVTRTALGVIDDRQRIVRARMQMTAIATGAAEPPDEADPHPEQ